MKGLLEVVQEVFAEIPTVVRKRKIGLADCLMLALAMFSMKSPSLLAFDGPTLEEPVMMLAFLIDQLQEASCGLFQKALEHRKTRRALWEKMKAVFNNFLIDSWTDLFTAIGSKFKGARLVINTS